MALTQIPTKSHWVVTGVAGFIGSHLLEHLLRLGHTVVGLDNFSTGSTHNLDDVQRAVSASQWRNFRLLKGDILDPNACKAACSGATYVLHQAALGSVPRSVKNPLDSNAANITGTLNMLVSAQQSKIKRFVFASSSSVYGDDPHTEKLEERTGNLLSPYAVTKHANEKYASVFHKTYGMETVGLRYFNVFGKRQNPNGDYAAVIPKWITSLHNGEQVAVYGDGETSRDFCYVENVVQANLLAATMETDCIAGKCFNIAVGQSTSLNALFNKLAQLLNRNRQPRAPIYLPFRAGDISHSKANIELAKNLLKYTPSHTIDEGLRETVPWYREKSLCS